MVKVTCLLAKAGSGVGLSFGVRALTQMEIRCVKGMFRLKLISSEKNSVFKGLKCTNHLKLAGADSYYQSDGSSDSKAA